MADLGEDGEECPHCGEIAAWFRIEDADPNGPSEALICTSDCDVIKYRYPWEESE